MTEKPYTTRDDRPVNACQAMSRRSVLIGAALPLAGIPDFSMPLRARPAPDPDAALREACNEYERQRAISNSATSTEDEADAAVAAVSRLCREIARTKPATPLGFACKARVVALENEWDLILSGQNLTPFRYDADAITFGLLADLMQGRPLT